jgi:hypothetical protein
MKVQGILPVAKQPESKVSTRIMKKWREMGAFCYKVHGSAFQMAGIPDISGVFMGSSVWCETKMPGNHTSLVQDVRINQLRQAGAHVVVAYSVTDATDMLQHLLAMKRYGITCVPGDCLYTTLKTLQ